MLIKNVEEKESKSGKPYRRIQDSGGKWYSCWNPALFKMLTEGGNVEVEVEEKDGFSNITDAKIVFADKAPQVSRQDNNREVSIERQVAIKEIGEWIRCTAPTKPLPSYLLNGYVEWLKNKLEVTSPDVVANRNSFANVGQLLNTCMEHGVTRPQVLGCLGEETLDGVDPNKAWDKIFKELIDPKMRASKPKVEEE